MKIVLSIYITLIYGLLNIAMACTTVIISGNYTVDGRPIIWKHRDTGTLDNKLIYLKSEKHSAIALIDSDDEMVENIWIGFNDAGFVIMNSASYNLKGDDTTQVSDLEGVLMKAALLTCATVDEFEQFLLGYKKPYGVEANFGVIDAFGGAAYFETDNYKFIKIDVNDKRIAPHGYVVRTNYSFSGDKNDGAGYIRFETAEKLFYRASGNDNLSVTYMLKEMCLSLENSYSKQSLDDFLDLSEHQENFMYFQDCINRYSSSSSVIVQGVKPNEPVEFTTMWAMIGFPLSSIPIPIWLTPNGTLPIIAQAEGKENAEICDLALKLKSIMVPSRRGSTKYYINTTRVFNAQGTGITQKLLPVHNEVYNKTQEKIEQWRKNGRLNQLEVDNFYKWTDEYVRKAYFNLFGLKI
jgi:hypothetical protein